MPIKWILVILVISVASTQGQFCQFRRDIAGSSSQENSGSSESSGSTTIGTLSQLHKDDCPCFHNDTQPGDCDVGSFHPARPLLPCAFLPEEFIECDSPIDHKNDAAAKKDLGYGCLKIGGGLRWEDIEKTEVCCRALDCIECRGNRTFLRGGVPCVKYSNHYFLTTLLYSILLGFLGLDRFSLGQTGTAVGKLVTVGGLGVWWIVDIFLIISGQLMPEDGSHWNPYA
ncbi:hypothetical protein TCAL_02863 [Tigriopus californicus]|uniref:TM2 domain-containing protein n=1 Tax=Tigriopus californicus TaxID=6832 RepID=A0A553NZ02_TIGCA|nr:TM2 domain-containing protein 2-like [Tigriopus californicus]TRY70654.1 hypothetical protein TCAL_02863 [Tigriopus californicus]|eukprot:TCALIF_02863-PA protein Name:"Similar to CG11103 TM2 domain-containing protein CG11103 (Drosophila melanogaster)" AED:0.47 eAED:0.47 QI:0/-1/0/1/-1/1/1/0/227